MSFYIRKSIKVGPLKFNLSKSGLGASVGVRGFRLGTGPRGHYVHAGRGGVYFRKSLNVPKKDDVRLPSSEPNFPQDKSSRTVGPIQEIDSGSIRDMVETSDSELLKELNEKRKKVRIFPFVVFLCIAFLVGLLVVTVPAWLLIIALVGSGGVSWLTLTKDKLRKTTVIFYELDEYVAPVFQQLLDVFEKLGACGRVWHIQGRGNVKDPKYHAGAGAVVNRKKITLQCGEPACVKTNVQIPLIPVGAQILAFMPDRLLVFESGGVGEVGYHNLELEILETEFMEEESVPHDTTVIGKTWRYVNKKGGPDRRFKNNPEIPICAYEQLHFSSNSGLNEVIQISRRDRGLPFKKALEEIGKFHKPQTST